LGLGILTCRLDTVRWEDEVANILEEDNYNEINDYGGLLLISSKIIDMCIISDPAIAEEMISSW
jgi:hypothetical protein